MSGGNSDASLQYMKTPSGIFAQVDGFSNVIIPCNTLPQPEKVMFKLVTHGNIRIKSRAGEQHLSDGMLSLMAWQPKFEETFISPSSLFVVGCENKMCKCVLPLLKNGGSISVLLEHQDLSYLTTLISHYINQVSGLSTTLSMVSGQMIISTLGDMLLASQNSRTSKLTSRMHNISAINVFIAENLHDVTLDAETISENLRLSVNYMNRLLAEENLSLMKLVWRFRLEEAKKLLLRPGMHETQLAEIAWLCGFSNQSHFSQAFKKHFGLTPGQMRATDPH